MAMAVWMLLHARVWGSKERGGFIFTLSYASFLRNERKSCGLIGTDTLHSFDDVYEVQSTTDEILHAQIHHIDFLFAILKETFWGPAHLISNPHLHLPIHLLNLRLITLQRGRPLHRPLGRPPHWLILAREHDQIPRHARLLVILRIPVFHVGPDAIDEFHALRRGHHNGVLLLMVMPVVGVVVAAADIAFVFDGDLQEFGMFGCEGCVVAGTTVAGGGGVAFAVVFDETVDGWGCGY